MSKSIVSIVVCDSYDKEKVYNSVRLGIDALGGIKRFVKPEEKILVKPNFLYPSESEKAITTHPSVISAVLRILEEAGCIGVSIGDSPASGTCRAALGKLALKDEELHGTTIAEMNVEIPTSFPDGRVCKEFHFCREVTEADAIIGVCKMKTHALEKITGAVKNMFGLICGRRKATYHVKYPTAWEFAKMLADIHRATPQRLHIMDGIVAMEGNGPASGTPTEMNVILISSDPVALDTAFCHLINLTPGLVPTNAMGSSAGIGTMDPNEIELLLTENGETVSIDIATLADGYGKPDFDVMREKDKFKTLLGVLSNIHGGNKKPCIDPAKCIRCGVCVEHCPVEGKGVDFKNGKDKIPVYDYKKCIRCYCCQELCPQHAISVRGR